MAFPNILFGKEGTQYNSYTDSRFALGQMLVMRDGRAYRFCLVGATTLVAGNLYQSALPIANPANRTPTATAVDAVTVNVTPGATTGAANLYAEGYLYVDTTPGVSYTYKVASHPAISASTASKLAEAGGRSWHGGD